MNIQNLQLCLIFCSAELMYKLPTVRKKKTAAKKVVKRTPLVGGYAARAMSKGKRGYYT